MELLEVHAGYLYCLLRAWVLIINNYWKKLALTPKSVPSYLGAVFASPNLIAHVCVAGRDQGVDFLLDGSSFSLQKLPSQY